MHIYPDDDDDVLNDIAFFKTSKCRGTQRRD